MVVRQLISLPSQLQLIARLQHHIYLSSSLIFVSGEKGMGKSTLLEQLPNKLSADVQQAFIQLHEQLSDAQIRQQIIMQWYHDPLFDAQDNLFTSIALQQEKQHSDDPRLIIFDNAQFLSSQLLSELVQLIAQRGSLSESEINILLLVDEDNCQQMLTFAKKAQQNGYLDCPCLEFKIDPLSSEEANSLLKHVFKQADYQHQIQHQDALSKQLNGCAGIAQKIVDLAEQIIAGNLVNNEPSWLKMRLPAFLLMLFLLLFAAALVNYRYPILFPLHSAVEFKEVTVSTQEKEHSEPVMTEALAGDWHNQFIPEIEDSSLMVGISDKSVKHLVLSEDNILALSPLNFNFSQDVDSKGGSGIQEGVKGQMTTETVAKAQTPEIPVNMAKSADSKTISNDSVAADSVMNEKIDKVERVTPVKNVEVVIKEKPHSIFTKKSLLLAIPSSHYTLQLSAMAAEKSLQDFINDYALPKKNVYIYQTVRNNKPWYVIIFGDYKSKSSAVNASTHLPVSFANMTPWIKNFKLVHQDLQLSHD